LRKYRAKRPENETVMSFHGAPIFDELAAMTAAILAIHPDHIAVHWYYLRIFIQEVSQWAAQLALPFVESGKNDSVFSLF
jgi:hypothetical protein